MENNNKTGDGMTTLDDRLKELINQQKSMEANFHQITGAIALVNQMIEDEKKEVKKEPKK